MKYFLDTNIISYFLKGKYPSIQDHFASVPAQDIFIPSIVVAEIEYGAEKSSDYKKTKAVYQRFINMFHIVSFSEKAAVHYGRIRSFLEKEGKLIGANDMLIAAIVLSEDGVLVTNNTSEFSRIPGLKTENWI